MNLLSMPIQMLNCKPIINRLFSSVTYLIISNEGSSAWVVDPGDMDRLTPYLNNTHIYISGVLLTHAHFDHIYGLNEIIALFPTTKVYTNEFGKRMLLNETDYPFMHLLYSQLLVCQRVCLQNTVCLICK